MLTLAKITDEDYWLRQVAGVRAERGRDGVLRYYAENGEVPGLVCGAGADALGLAGQRVSVDEHAEAYHRLMAGQDPETGAVRVAGSGRPGEARVKGWDALISAPKSVSLLWALGGAEVRAVIEAAHAEACREAFRHFDAQVARARAGKGGVRQLETDGLIAVAFQHRCSRSGDPSLHTHHTIANQVHCADGRWRTLDGRLLYTQARTAGTLYQGHLRGLLAQPVDQGGLGLEWQPVVNGLADVTGIRREWIDHFSKRHHEIAEDLADATARATVQRAALGLPPLELGSAAAQEVARRQTRPAKESGQTTAELVARWATEAATIGATREAITTPIGRRTTAVAAAAMTDRLARTWGARLTAQANVYGVRDVIQVAASRRAGIAVDDALGLASAYLATDEAVGLGVAEALRSGDVIARRDGRRVVVPQADQERWTTPEVLALERGVMAAAERGRTAGAGRVEPGAVTAALQAHPELGQDQVAAVVGLTTDGQRISVVEAAAGTGKTTMVAAARAAWAPSGIRVIGAAVSARARDGLAEGSGIEPCATVARLVGEITAHGLARGTVVILDEASMVGLRDLAVVADAVERNHGKLVLLGDTRQLHAIDAVGPFARLARAHAYPLTENRRQVAAWERAALELVRAGAAPPRAARDDEAPEPTRAAQAVAVYAAHGRLVTADPDAATPQAARADLMVRMVTDWERATRQGQACWMLAGTHADRRALNALARERLVAAGTVAADGMPVGDRTVARGDVLQCQRNQPTLGVVNGQRVVVEAVSPRLGQVRVRTAGGQPVTLGRAYVRHHVDHAYASTVHKEQGRTCDIALVLADPASLSQQWGYVALSRGRDRNTLYWAGPRRVEADHHGPAEAVPDAARQQERVAAGLARRADKVLALDLRDRAATVAPALVAALDRGDLDAAEATLAAAQAARQADAEAGRERAPGLAGETDPHIWTRERDQPQRNRGAVLRR